MSEACKEKTTFVCKFGNFSFEVMPFGLMNAPATFQRMMDQILSGYPFVQVYIDDVVIVSSTLDEHVKHIREAVRLISSHGLKIKLQK
jgi:Reverse transcriptase (RNA-dependent DNA polymerase)